ncbi:hypothetical protein [Leifsonia sp. Root112D2]|uniref:hypothetical protein n=1 Tax=Leifsonia sp. Root112D2 TaxID=1736426 RepID=UPI000700F870|nr:hypothetical protein [Leifsonia sp. Root112D2]KQV06695.1 hypothetical protein ASC63_04650 [Leifsonia sp. Root112D2]
MEPRPVRDGVEGFVADLGEFGVKAAREGPSVMYDLEILDGSRAGTPIRTGVSINELGAWPAVPAHWLHFEVGTHFSQQGSTDTSDVLPGYIRHSWDTSFWLPTEHPGRLWIAHVRSVLGKVI